MDAVPADIKDSYAAYGCRINDISVDELFRRYEAAGFLYPAKLPRLRPYWSLVKENWEKASDPEGRLIKFWIYEKDGSWATCSTWRTGGCSWLSQHLVATGDVGGSAAVQLSGQAMKIHFGDCDAEQNWFRPTNRFPMKVFGSMADKLGADVASCQTHTLLSVHPATLPTDDSDAIVIEETADYAAVVAVADATRGRVFVEAEDLRGDLRLEATDELYQRFGLSRTRRVFLARRKGDGQPIGVALTYRGPLGLNFSFLENRCDLLLLLELAEDERLSIATGLLHAAAPAYKTFEPGAFPAVTDAATASLLAATEACEIVREYAQSIWLRDGFVGWYRHVEGFYERIQRAGRRRGLAKAPAADAVGGAS